MPLLHESKSAAFWDELSSCWGHRAFLCKDASTLRIAPDEMVAALRRAGQIMLKKLPDSPHGFLVRIYCEGGEVTDIFEKAHFVPDETSLDDFLTAINAHLDGRQFGIAVNEYQFVAPQIWGVLSPFFGEVVERHGLHVGSITCALFFGTYQRTPFGIHQDEHAVLQLGIMGKKRMLLWPASYFAPNPLDHLLAKGLEGCIEAAQVLECCPGDIIYFPEGYWHTADIRQPQALSATISVGLGMQLRVDTYVESIVSRLVTPRLPERAFVLRGTRPQGAPLPDEIVTAIRELESLAKSGELMREAESKWQARQQTLGFKPPPHLAALMGRHRQPS